MATCWPPAWTDATPAGPVPAPSLSPPISKSINSCFCSHKALCWQAVGNVWNNFPPPCVSGQLCSVLWQRRCHSAVQVPRGLRWTFLWEVSADTADPLCTLLVKAADYRLRWAELYDTPRSPRYLRDYSASHCRMSATCVYAATTASCSLKLN